MTSFKKITIVDVSVEAGGHPLEKKYRDGIDAYWKERRASNPALFNGDFYLTVDCSIDGERLEAICRRTDFATFLFWLDHPTNIEGVFHIFSLAAMVSTDNKILMGKMATHTANAGRVYIPSGSISDDDLSNGKMDFDGCMRREAFEETGVKLNPSQAQDHFTLIEKKGVLALIKGFSIDLTSYDLLKQVNANLPLLEEQELEGVYAYGPGEIDETMPEFLKDYQLNRIKKVTM